MCRKKKPKLPTEIILVEIAKHLDKLSLACLHVALKINGGIYKVQLHKPIGSQYFRFRPLFINLFKKVIDFVYIDVFYNAMITGNLPLMKYFRKEGYGMSSTCSSTWKGIDGSFAKHIVLEGNLKILKWWYGTCPNASIFNHRVWFASHDKPDIREWLCIMKCPTYNPNPMECQLCFSNDRSNKHCHGNSKYIALDHTTHTSETLMDEQYKLAQRRTVKYRY
jgi:hypothetical protein